VKISIITICYNRAASIENAIRSVLSQDYAHIEYIVVDGASTDGTQQVIEKYRDRITTYLSEPDTGMYNALNKAIRLATGDVIGILHSDDAFASTDTISRYAAEFIRSNADVVYANGVYIQRREVRGEKQEVRGRQEGEVCSGQFAVNSKTIDNGSLVYEHETRNSKLETRNTKHETVGGESVIKRIYNSAPFKPWYLYLGWIPLHTTIMVRREVFDNYGLYDESYSIASDYEISLRWFTQSNLKKVHLKLCVVKMLLGGKSTSMALQKKKSTEDNRVLKQYKLWGKLTLLFKIVRKIPQYIQPYFTTQQI